MAMMKVILKTKEGAEVLATDLTGATEYPDVILHDGKTYVLKRLSPDKRNAWYAEVTVYTLEEA